LILINIAVINNIFHNSRNITGSNNQIGFLNSKYSTMKKIMKSKNEIKVLSKVFMFVLLTMLFFSAFEKKTTAQTPKERIQGLQTDLKKASAASTNNSQNQKDLANMADEIKNVLDDATYWNADGTPANADNFKKLLNAKRDKLIKIKKKADKVDGSIDRIQKCIDDVDATMPAINEKLSIIPFFGANYFLPIDNDVKDIYGSGLGPKVGLKLFPNNTNLSKWNIESELDYWGKTTNKSLQDGKVKYTLKVIPLTFSGVYNFSNKSKITPYLGGGFGLYFVEKTASGSYMDHMTNTTKSISERDSKSPLGVHASGGIAIPISAKWAFDLGVKFSSAKVSDWNMNIGGTMIFAGLKFSPWNTRNVVKTVGNNGDAVTYTWTVSIKELTDNKLKIHVTTTIASGNNQGNNKTGIGCSWKVVWPDGTETGGTGESCTVESIGIPGKMKKGNGTISIISKNAAGKKVVVASVGFTIQ
jgi:hypothetical protein